MAVIIRSDICKNKQFIFVEKYVIEDAIQNVINSEIPSNENPREIPTTTPNQPSFSIFFILPVYLTYTYTFHINQSCNLRSNIITIISSFRMVLKGIHASESLCDGCAIRKKISFPNANVFAHEDRSALVVRTPSQCLSSFFHRLPSPKTNPS